jgi:hypothetical protein
VGQVHEVTGSCWCRCHGDITVLCGCDLGRRSSCGIVAVSVFICTLVTACIRSV